MGKGLDLARPDAPEHVQLLEDLRDQLLIVLIKRLAVDGKLAIPIAEIDNTASDLLAFSLDLEKRLINFELRRNS